MILKNPSYLKTSFKFNAPRGIYFVIFAISGFSGLIYESIWSHYLKLFLGHAAYAQSLVLIIFMGGMAAGSWLASLLSTRSRTPILIYAIVEGIIGLGALVFHGIFTELIETFYLSILPSIGSVSVGSTLKWLAAGSLILPQSILLGMTFPLMSAGVIRRFPSNPGSSLATLYFTNSIGAAIGVLVNGFWLLKIIGLPGAIMTAGLINIALAIIVWILVRMDNLSRTEPIKSSTESGSQISSLTKVFIFAAFITGAASFVYEIGWIRMLSLVLGTTTHSFELMLSSFITGLALGGLWIRRRIDKINNPVSFSGYVQLLMGVFALLTIPVYMMSFDWMTNFMQALDKTDSGYAVYNISSHLIALVIMLPATFMAGMTLPLFTYTLIREGQGESAIGRIYAANMIGAITGILFALHIGLTVLGLKNLIIFGALLDILLGLFLLWRSTDSTIDYLRKTLSTITAVIAICSIFFLVEMNKKIMVSGVYRYGHTKLGESSTLEFYEDGKTATVSMIKSTDNILSLATNGKIDASVNMNTGTDHKPRSDEFTMILAGSIPLAYKPDAKRIANIGMGSGLTTHVMLANSDVEVVDTIEIEAEMVNASRLFGNRVARAHSDQRSNIYIEDAKTFFSIHNNKYDIIVAEPSNPWVSGVASLFSNEFYRMISNYLDNDGLFVQWIQLYEFTDELSVSILKALTENFGDFVIYTPNGFDILFIAQKQGTLSKPDWKVLDNNSMRESLKWINIESIADLELRKVADRNMLLPYLTVNPSPMNSDYYPFVDLNAARAQYKKNSVELFASLATAPVPLLEMLLGEKIDFDSVTSGQDYQRGEYVDIAKWIFEKVSLNSIADPDGADDLGLNRTRFITDWLLMSTYSCAADANPKRWHISILNIFSLTIPFLEQDRSEELINKLTANDCKIHKDENTIKWLKLYRAIANRDAEKMSLIGHDLLSEKGWHDINGRKYLLTVTILGDIVANRPLEAYKLWHEQGATIFHTEKMPDYLKLLVAIVSSDAAEKTMHATR